MSRNHIFVLCMLISFLSGCSETIFFKYDLIVSSINKTPLTEETNCYADNEITICFDYYRGFIRININNNSNSTLFLIWDKSSFIDSNNKNIVRNNTRIIDGFNPSIITVISPNKNMTDYITTSDKFFWTNGYYDGEKYIQGTWNSIGIFPYKTESDVTFLEENPYFLKVKKYYTLKRVQLLITFERNNQENLEYIFEIEIKNVNIDYNMTKE